MFVVHADTCSEACAAAAAALNAAATHQHAGVECCPASGVELCSCTVWVNQALGW